MDKKFALIGAAGYIAPRHMRAIKENNCELAVAVDPFDSIGIIDSYFPEAHFFSEIERFDRYVDRLKRTEDKIDYFSICSPNYLHDSHIRLGLRNNCDVICEKPLVINWENLEHLKAIEAETGRKVYTILQLRHHPSIIALKEKYKDFEGKVAVDLDYITSRGKWYHSSWKGQESKSGGLAANIGIHFFDMLTWIFGKPTENIVLEKGPATISGILELERAYVKWYLSIDGSNLPEEAVKSGQRAYRNITIDGDSLEFTNGFTDLHTVAYREILEGRGFGIDEATESLKIVNKILNYGV